MDFKIVILCVLLLTFGWSVWHIYNIPFYAFGEPADREKCAKYLELESDKVITSRIGVLDNKIICKAFNKSSGYVI